MKKYKKKTATRKTVEIPIYTLWEDPQHVFTNEDKTSPTTWDFSAQNKVRKSR